MDRVDIKQFIPQPSATVIYEIYRSCLEDLSQCGIIKGLTFDVIQLDPGNPKTPLRYIESDADYLILPSHDEMLIGFQIFPESIPRRLADVADASVVSTSRSQQNTSQIRDVFTIEL
jgi:pachytene checkpoint protein 2